MKAIVLATLAGALAMAATGVNAHSVHVKQVHKAQPVSISKASLKAVRTNALQRIRPSQVMTRAVAHSHADGNLSATCKVTHVPAGAIRLPGRDKAEAQQ